MIPHVASLLALAGLVTVHLVAGRLRFLDVVPRSRLLSLAGGMSVAYVFLRILPDLARWQLRVGTEVSRVLWVPRHSVYTVALAGLVLFYGLERLADASRRARRRARGDDCAGPGVFWVGITSNAVVNFVLGYLLVLREAAGGDRLFLFFLAMALWFVVNDFGLRSDYRHRYESVGRWVLAGALASGWAAAVWVGLPDLVLSLLVAFVAGGVVLNVLKEELPRERESRFWAFGLGAALYSALLLAL